jgi:hypothetical protein
LQCRTHGQKYLLSLQEIQKSIQNNNGQMDKKVYQKIQRYEDDKRFLHRLYLEDSQNRDDPNAKLNLEFQSEQARIQFEKSIPDYVL